MGCQLCASKQTVQVVNKDLKNNKKSHEKDSNSKKNHEELINPEQQDSRHEAIFPTTGKVETLQSKEQEKFEELVIHSEEMKEELKVLQEGDEKVGEKIAEIDETLENSLPLGEGGLELVEFDYSSFDKIILLIGDSGSGKSSFLNLTHNFLSENRTLDSIQVLTSTEKCEPTSQAQSSLIRSGFHLSTSTSFTKEILLIPLKNPKNSKTFLFIDTPGFTRSEEIPDTCTTTLINSFISTLPRLDTVLYMHRSSQTSFDTSLKLTLSEFRPSFESFNSKIIAIYTFAGSKFDVKHDSLPFTRSSVQKKYFTINNLPFGQSRGDLNDKKKLKGNQATYEQTLNKLHSFIDSLN
jgi:energy-coupling factor transporter ATP-binding protein EcfA2